MTTAAVQSTSKYGDPKPWVEWAAGDADKAWLIADYADLASKVARYFAVYRNDLVAAKVADGFGTFSSGCYILVAPVEGNKIVNGVKLLWDDHFGKAKISNEVAAAAKKEIVLGFFNFNYAWTESVQFFNSIGLAVGRALSPISIVGSASSIIVDTIKAVDDCVTLKDRVQEYRTASGSTKELRRDQIIYRAIDLTMRVIAVSLWVMAIISASCLIANVACPIPFNAILIISTVYVFLKGVTYFFEKSLEEDARRLNFSKESCSP